MAHIIQVWAVILSILSLFAQSTQPPLAQGKLTYYGKGVMEESYVNQVRNGHVTSCSDCIGQVAMIQKEHLDRKVWLGVRGTVIGPFHVVDCAGADFKRTEIVAEVSWQWGKALGMSGPIDVVVYDYNPLSDRSEELTLSDDSQVWRRDNGTHAFR